MLGANGARAAPGGTSELTLPEQMCVSSSVTMRFRHFAVSAIVGLLPWLTGCPDPEGAYTDFAARRAKIVPDMSSSSSSGAGGSASCAAPPAAGEADGEWIFLLTVEQSPDKPAPLRALITNTDTEFTMELTPMNADDRSSDVGGSLGSFGPFSINADTSFTAELGQIAAPGETNPITASPLTIVATLDGTFCPGDFQCGTVSGDILEPLMIPLGGDWTLTRASAYMEEPVTNCNGKTAAPL